jgi:hypothetical protein
MKMSRTDDRTEPRLPVTGEVGGEGGSFADPTVQVATSRGRLDYADGVTDADMASRPVRSESVTADAAEDVKAGMVKSPDEE